MLYIYIVETARPNPGLATPILGFSRETLQALDRESLIQIVLNLQEEIRDHRIAIQELKDELRRLRGEKGRPGLKPSVPDEPAEGKKRKTGLWRKSGKTITVTRREWLAVDQRILPKDAVFKGTRKILIQDIKILTDNVEFEIERYYSPSEKKTYEASLPPDYDGSFFGPGIRHLVLVLHYQGRMPQKLLQTLLSGLGVLISEGEISALLLKSRGFEEEQAAARQAGTEKHDYQHIDDTGARVCGKNGATIVTGNESFVAYRTGLHKDRLSALKALRGTDTLDYLIDDWALAYVRAKLPTTTLDAVLERFKNRSFPQESEFEAKVLGHRAIHRFRPAALRYVREAAAIAAFRAQGATRRLVCDDAGQFKGLTDSLQLCWVHVARHFKDLDPVTPDFRRILDEFLAAMWDYYDRLKDYRHAPKNKKLLFRKFDEVFKPDTGYYALDKRIKKAMKQKAELLTVLEYPDTPLHNNPCELDTREKVVQRKIRNCHRSYAGAKASDIFLGLMGTCRKNNVSFWNYLKDRVYKTGSIPELKEIILAD
jgi:hypothetical protein